MKRLGTSIPLNQRKSVLFCIIHGWVHRNRQLFDDMCHYMSIYNAPDRIGLPPRIPFGEERS